MMNIKKIIILVTVLLLITSAFFFDKTDGLLEENTKEYYVKDLMSSGSDDNLCITISQFIFIPFFIYMIRIKDKITVFEFACSNIVLLFQLVLIFAIECGSIINTILNGNFCLLLWGLLYISLIIETNIFYFYEKIKK